MATRSAIIAKFGPDDYRGIYCHNDGYLDGVGRTLALHYADPEKVRELVALGDISSLGESVEAGSTCAYKRDCREEDTDAIRRSSAKEVAALIDHQFAYVYEDGRWTCDGADISAAYAPEKTPEAPATVGVEKVQRAVKLAWDEAGSHGNPFVSLESVLLALGMADAAYTDATGHRALDFSRLKAE